MKTVKMLTAQCVNSDVGGGIVNTISLAEERPQEKEVGMPIYTNCKECKHWGVQEKGCKLNRNRNDWHNAFHCIMHELVMPKEEKRERWRIRIF